MLVRTIENNLIYNKRVYERGSVVEVDDQVGQYWIGSGAAEVAVAPREPKATPKRGRKPKAETADLAKRLADAEQRSEAP